MHLVGKTRGQVKEKIRSESQADEGTVYPRRARKAGKNVDLIVPVVRMQITFVVLKRRTTMYIFLGVSAFAFVMSAAFLSSSTKGVFRGTLCIAKLMYIINHCGLRFNRCIPDNAPDHPLLTVSLFPLIFIFHSCNLTPLKAFSFLASLHSTLITPPTPSLSCFLLISSLSNSSFYYSSLSLVVRRHPPPSSPRSPPPYLRAINAPENGARGSRVVAWGGNAAAPREKLSMQ